MKKKNIYLDGIMGLVVADALGCPVEFMTREELAVEPVIGMREYGTHNRPKGSWTDDSSMALATLDALIEGYDVAGIQENFVNWLYDGEYTADGVVFDAGITCENAIHQYVKHKSENPQIICGLDDEYSNGNGSLMRILPVCIYVYEQNQKGNMTNKQAIEMVHEVSALTHAHIRSKIACGLYYFIVKAILHKKEETAESIVSCIENGLNEGFAFYESYMEATKELCQYNRLRNMHSFASVGEEQIKSSGYVVDSLEAAIWSLVNTDSYEQAVLKAVNLGSDTDTVGAIAGGLAGLYYGVEAIPKEWKQVILRREWIEMICDEALGISIENEIFIEKKFS
ncbi:MAG: ADP-ribosylglycohydrolase family protein [Lachnospiraceae bacterium]|nr:ADP-ribosylglycohydrolase family protein [Lachnospiraceae bacterium]